ncbi:MAG: hypothetical protein ACREQW_08760 [Candidatus Binatia bacterium]
MLSWFRKPALYIFWLCFSCGYPAWAAISPVSIESEIGFNGRFQLGHPFPVQITLINNGPTAEGRLEVQVWKRGGPKGIDSYPVYYRKQVFLAAQARKPVTFTVDPDFLSRPLQVSFASPGHKATQEIDLRPHFSTRPLLLLVSGSHAPVSVPLPAGLMNPLATVQIADLPSDPRAYLGVWAALFYEQPLREMSRGQVFSLETWLLWGGRIVAIGGVNDAVFQDANWARLLPVRVTGLRKFSGLPSLEKAYATPISARELWAHDVTVLKGKALVEEQGHPILVEASHGRGKVVFLALDVGRPPLLRWAGLARLFADVLGSPAEFRLTWAATWDDLLFSRILSSPSFLPYYAPAVTFLLWLLAYAAALGLLASYSHNRGLSRGVLLGFGFSLSALFSLAGYVHFDRGGKPLDGVLFSATVLEELANGHVEAQSNIALFSTRQRSYHLQLERGWSHLEMLSLQGKKNEGHPVAVWGDGASGDLDLQVGEWSYRLLRVRWVIPLALQVRVETRNDTVQLTIANQSGRVLTECWFIVAGKALFLGDIPARSNLVREFPRSDREGIVKKTQGDISFSDPLRELLFRHAFFNDQVRARDGDGGAVFLGWMQDAPGRARVADARISSLNYTLFRASFPLPQEDEL